MQKFRELKGLPVYGPEPVQFSATGQGMHREGYVIEFLPGSAEKWVGNFQPGLGGLSRVVEHPDSRDLIVIAGGQAYVISPEIREMKATFGGQIEYCQYVSEIDSIVLGNGLWFDIVGQDGRTCQTERISWDGMRHISISDTTLTGEAFDPMTESWKPFTVNLLDGSHDGGSFSF